MKCFCIGNAKKRKLRKSNDFKEHPRNRGNQIKEIPRISKKIKENRLDFERKTAAVVRRKSKENKGNTPSYGPFFKGKEHPKGKEQRNV